MNRRVVITFTAALFGLGFWSMTALSADDDEKKAAQEAVLKLVDAEEPPLRMMLGNKNLPAARAAYADRLATWELWEAVSNAAQGSRWSDKLKSRSAN